MTVSVDEQRLAARGASLLFLLDASPLKEEEPRWLRRGCSRVADTLVSSFARQDYVPTVFDNYSA
eukprot:CAMPEP_0115881608 /NCGR_PEP_ID=MMETSP0287-20121206/28536_1 /TAXON_ID=412157 /ORGANISM="Chrysochromulina rotalis, Strain UIO044" /LENGTH=64 /DNA_ID=CAMNT_0003337579 /DNA_START=54 /DNA_END=245 /DNA_ORIENTATION=-